MNSSESRPRKTNVNVLLPGTKSAILRHTETSEVVVCIYGSAIERFYDDEGNETEMVVMTAGGNWPHDDRKGVCSRQECVVLNGYAEEICNER